MRSSAEMTKLRRWAVELVAPNAPIDTVADLQQICRAADVLIEYHLTGTHPAEPKETSKAGPDGDGRDGGGPPPAEPRPN